MRKVTRIYSADRPRSTAPDDDRVYDALEELGVIWRDVDAVDEMPMHPENRWAKVYRFLRTHRTKIVTVKGVQANSVQNVAKRWPNELEVRGSGHHREKGTNRKVCTIHIAWRVEEPEVDDDDDWLDDA